MFNLACRESDGILSGDDRARIAALEAESHPSHAEWEDARAVVRSADESADPRVDEVQSMRGRSRAAIARERADRVARGTPIGEWRRA